MSRTASSFSLPSYEQQPCGWHWVGVGCCGERGSPHVLGLLDTRFARTSAGCSGYYALVRHAGLGHVCLNALGGSQERMRSRAHRSAREAHVRGSCDGQRGPPRTRESTGKQCRAGQSRRVTRCFHASAGCAFAERRGGRGAGWPSGSASVAQAVRGGATGC